MKIEDLETYLKNTEVIFSKDKTVSANVTALYDLLIEHPYFTERVGRLREKYTIPAYGFKGGQEAFLWEHQSQKRYEELVKDVYTLRADFNIPVQFLSEIFSFMYDYVLSEDNLRKIVLGWET